MIYLDSATAYLADWEEGLRIVDVTRTLKPADLGRYKTGGQARSVAGAGRFAYFGEEDGIVRLIDITNPERPPEIGFYKTGGILHRISIHNGYIYVADIVNGMHVLKNDVKVSYSPGRYDFGSLALGVIWLVLL